MGYTEARVKGENMRQVVKAQACIRALQRAGFVIDRQKGSHITLIRDQEDMPYGRTTIPNHNKPLNPAHCARSLKTQPGSLLALTAQSGSPRQSHDGQRDKVLSGVLKAKVQRVVSLSLVHFRRV
jgi:predicted RNA binding protein YcfA (HicA-like mRNA interferase family)